MADETLIPPSQLPSSTGTAITPGTVSGSTPTPTSAGTTITSGPASGSTPTTGGTNQLAKDRIALFEQQIKDPVLLNRMEFVLNKEGGKSGHLIFESACNRAMFGNKTLKTILFQKDYFKDAKKDPNADKTKPYSKYTTDIINRVIYNGSNETNLATDQGYNDKTLFMKRTVIDKGVTGSWFNLNTGAKITDPGRIATLNTTPGNGMEEFIYQKCGWGDGHSRPGARAHAYGIKYNIQSGTPSSYNANTPVPPELEKASTSELTGNPTRTVTSPPAVVNNTDPHGPTVIKNTNDMPKGMYVFPGVGAMVWVFFREGNPLFPVYFAASYSAEEWKGAYNGASLNPEGTNNGTVGSQVSNSLRLNPNAGGGLEFTHVKDASDPSGAHDKTVAMMYGDDGSNMMFSKGYHQIYTRHDRRDQVDGHLYNIIGGAEEKWVEDDSSCNTRGNVTIKIGKVDAEAMEIIKELSDFSKQMNDTLMSNSSK